MIGNVYDDHKGKKDVIFVILFEQIRFGLEHL